MKIFCPNCDASFEIKINRGNAFGQNFHCSQCTQQWFHYNLIKSDDTDNQEDAVVVSEDYINAGNLNYIPTKNI